MGARKSKGRKKRNSYNKLVLKYKHAKARLEASLPNKIRDEHDELERSIAKQEFFKRLEQLGRDKVSPAGFVVTMGCEFRSCPNSVSDICRSPGTVKHDGFGRCLLAVMCLEEEDGEEDASREGQGVPREDTGADRRAEQEGNQAHGLAKQEA